MLKENPDVKDHIAPTFTMTGYQSKKKKQKKNFSIASPNLFQAPLNAAVLTGHHFAVPVVCGSAGHAEIWVTLPHSQVAGTLLGVTLSLTSAAWETVLAWKPFRHE